MDDIFISYSSANREFALSIAERLEQFYGIWIDREGIEGGMQWEQAIVQALTDCTVFIVIISPQSNDSEWVARETILAEQQKKARIPILLDGELPFRLLNLHYIDFQGDFEGGFRDLLEALNQHLEPQDKTREAVNQLLGEAIRAQLAGDNVTARNFVGQALAIQPDLHASIDDFWKSLVQIPQTNYADIMSTQVHDKSDLIQSRVQVAKNALYDDRETYEWFLTVDSPDDGLDQIDYVQYELHHSFNNPMRIIRDRKSRFLLRFVGWGTFDIPITIQFNDGSQITTHHELQFPE